MSTTDGANRGVDDIPDQIHAYLSELDGHDECEHHRTYCYSQALRQIMRHLDPDDIVVVDATRNVRNHTDTLAMTGDLADSLTWQVVNKQSASLSYDRRDGRPFPWDDLERWLNDNDQSVYDLAVNRIVIRFRDDALFDALFDMFNTVLGVADCGDFKQPFHAEFRTGSIGNTEWDRAIRDRIYAEHEARYFISGGRTDSNGNRGLGWSPRTLNLTNLWSLRAFKNEQDPVLIGVDGDLTMRDVEELAINRYESDSPVYCARHSTFVKDAIQNAINPGLVNRRKYGWDDTGEWERIG